MGLKKALESVGDFGRYQWFHFLLIALTFKLTQHFQSIGIIFTGFEPPHHCTIPPNATRDDVIPTRIGSDGDPEPAQCHQFKVIGDNSSDIVECFDGWDYEAGLFDPEKGTIVMEWDLVCKNKDVVLYSITILNLGISFGAFIASSLGDVVGRRPVFITSMLLCGVLGVANGLVPGPISFCVLCFFRGIATSGVLTQGLVLLGELVPQHLVALLFPICGLFDGVGQALVPIISLMFTQWRHLQIALSCAAIASLPYAIFAPESLTWLMGKDRKECVKKQLQKIAAFNSKTVNKDKIDELLEGVEENKPRVADRVLRSFLTHKETALYLFIMSFLYFVHFTLHYGQNLLQGSLFGDIHVNFVINALLVIPGQLVALPTMALFGRRYAVFIFYTLQAICIAFAGAAKFIDWPESINEDYVVNTFTLATRLWIAATTPVISFYAQELFPTPIRSTLMGVVNGCGSIGTVIAPFVSLSLIRIKYWIPGSIFGGISILAALLILMLPETTGRGMPDTVQEVVRMPRSLSKEEKKEQRSLFTCCKKEKETNTEEQMRDKVTDNSEEILKY